MSAAVAADIVPAAAPDAPASDARAPEAAAAPPTPAPPTAATLPPALTWLHLFSGEATIDCDACPAWLVEKVRRHAKVATPGDENIDAVVSVNGGRAAVGRLEAGFAHVRRYAVLPSLEKARWFVPLDSGRIAAAGFDIYTPARASAHFKKFAAKLAARLRVPGWYRDEIVVASRRPLPLESTLAGLFPGVTPRIGLSAGAPEPAINRKASGIVIDQDGRVVGFVKIAESPIARRIAMREVEVLPALSRQTSLKGLTPTLLFAGEIKGGRYLTVQAPLAGRNVPPARWTAAHERFLAALRIGPIKPADQTEMAATLSDRIAALREPRAYLSDALDGVRRTLAGMNVPSTIVHGDFAPWNLRSDGGRISAFDWEYAELDGLPLIDRTHFTLQLSYQMHGRTPLEAQSELDTLARSRPLGLEPRQVRAIQVIYLLDNLTRLLGEGYPADDEMIAWYTKLLGRLVAAQSEAVLA